ncbi:FAS1-like dehydratase domain-containing protein, partial [Streptomyces durhamensis]|uniref:FAS1-like dehydratase domain-containing protein n=1 Tax=Streptomyces durhamensis TaxID=68194 RepID=UPI003157FFB8
MNVPMIRHWVEAMGDTNPIYLDDAAARDTGRAGIIAPATMVQAWTMRGYGATITGGAASDTATQLLGVLADAGFTSVVATDSEQEYFTELRPGTRINVTEVIESISPEKKTGLGVGHFVTTLKT